MYSAGYSLARRGALVVAAAGFIVGVLVAPTALAVVTVSGNGNQDGASLSAAGGPGGANEFGFVNVGRSSTGNASVTYLGNGWAITAAHVAISSGVGPVSFGGVNYTVDNSSITVLVNPDNSLADLKLFRLTTDPGLPSITPQLLSASSPSGRQIMIGNGLDIGSPEYWNANKSQALWQWSTQAAPGTPGPNDYAGFQTLTSRHLRWGENEVHATGLFEFISFDSNNNPRYIHGYSTQFDDELYTGTPGLPSEAQVSLGDSGGGVFTFDNGQWKLAGIMIAIQDLYNNQPFSASNIPTTMYGNQALIADLSVYRSQILAIVPEPAGLALAVLALAALGSIAWRRRR